MARELELGSEEGLNHRFIVLLLGVDGHYDSGHCSLGLSKGTEHTCLEPRQNSMPVMKVH